MTPIKKIALKLDEFKSKSGLVFDTSIVESNCLKTREVLKRYSILFSVKSFPNLTFLEVLSPHLDGWDISAQSELELVRKVIQPSQSLWLTNSSFSMLKEACKVSKSVYFTLDLQHDLEIPIPTEVNLGLRIDPYSCLGRGHSRYGYLKSQIPNLPLELRERVKYLHSHVPGELLSLDLKLLREGIESVLKYFPKLESINLGGGLSEGNLDAFEMLQELFPDPKLVIEPGRWFSNSAGFAYSEIKAVFMKEHELFVISDLSPEAHMKWARKVNFNFLNFGKSETWDYQRLTYCSANALEVDRLCLKESSGKLSIGVGDFIIFSNIPGYAVAWNHQFNGIPELPVYFIP